MDKYLGEENVAVKNSPYKDYTKEDWALLYIRKYGGIDGAHHKDWVLDQVARILHGSTITLKLAKWDDGTEEWRVDVDEENEPDAYTNWVKNIRGEWDEEWECYEYDYDCGTPP